MANRFREQIETVSRRTVLSGVGGVLGSLGLIGTTGTAVTDESKTTVTTQESTDSGWPQTRYDAGHTGYNPNTSAPQETPGSRWTTDRDITNPVVAEKTLYGVQEATAETRQRGVVALSTRTGEEQWRFDDVERPTGPAVERGTVYVGSERGVHALDAATGMERWFVETELPAIGELTVADGTLYLILSKSNDRYETTAAVVGVDAESGNTLWQRSLEVEPNHGTPRPPVVLDETVYTRDSTGVIALDATDGSLRWRSSVSGQVGAAADGAVYLYWYETVTALDADDGSKRWEYDTEAADTVTSVPAVVDDTLYVGVSEEVYEGSSGVYALNTTDGSERWSQSDEALVSSPVVADGVVYTTISNRVDFPSDLDLLSGSLFARDADDGRRLWSLSPPEASTFDFLITADDTLFARTNEYSTDSPASRRFLALGTGDSVDPVPNEPKQPEEPEDPTPPDCSKQPVRIDIAPGDPTGTLDRSEPCVDVVLFRNQEFDPTTLAVESLRFGPERTVTEGGGARVRRTTVNDVDDNDYDDLIVTFRLSEGGFEPNDLVGAIVGETTDGTPVAGFETVNVR